jgi:hypothetical protein
MKKLPLTKNNQKNCNAQHFIETVIVYIDPELLSLFAELVKQLGKNRLKNIGLVISLTT